MVGAAVGSALAGGYSAYRSNQNAKEAQAQQAQQYQNDLAIRLGLQGQQDGLYGPLENRLVQEASSDQPLYYGQMAGGINRNYDAAQRNLASQMAARGMGGSALQGASTAGMEMGRSGQLAQAFQQGLQARTSLGLNMVSRYQPLMNDMYTSGGYGQLGGMYGQQAGQANMASQMGWGDFGSSLMNLAKMWPDPGPDATTQANPANTLPTQGNIFSPLGANPGYNTSIMGLQPASVGTTQGLNISNPMLTNPLTGLGNTLMKNNPLSDLPGSYTNSVS